MAKRVVLVIITLLYPLAVYMGLQNFDARHLVLLLIVIAGIRMVSLGESPLNHWFWLPLLTLLGVWTWLLNSPLALKLYPVLVSASFLVLFLWSLKSPTSMIERIARLQDPQLPERGVVYTRKVTKVWCCFFGLNGSVALAITLYGTDAQWALYNGLISYLCMGTLFAAEWLVRQRVMKSA
ncbi:MAG: hypothetical protein KUG71_13790 [Porticoccaceae bacterium]|nr:hypothetical protein [Porticoccaceae bacterium]